MESPTKQYIPDRVDVPDQDFGYNRTKANYAAVKAICDKAKYFLVEYSDGTGTVIGGTAQTWRSELTRGAAQEATLHIVASSIADVDDTTSYKALTV